MPTPRGQMTVTLTGELERFVRDKVSEGVFATPSEYIRELVRTRYLAEHDRDARMRRVDAALAAGVADAEAGRLVPAGEAFARVRAALGLTDEDPSA
ncbi:type II toxin-antitoxin system ParD family antitoxin [Methylobacterium sp. J-076]|uniref:ribbon-helix-helix domain-containing protein n=1 Tax=Methylobacterium sp. J-076 TaxID=2836655 RepID=UPI001FBABFA9|nr:ribbon-helix-helix domain-containing protein [Methylobacterium sp. J-076]MCJ2014931.1 ribbon-helix-helix domain-containing protein [Methylobacterium sp. J-076]